MAQGIKDIDLRQLAHLIIQQGGGSPKPSLRGRILEVLRSGSTENAKGQLDMEYTHILELAKEAEPPADGILSRTIFQDDRLKAVLFGFGQGQELSEHTASKPAMLFFIKGEANVGLGDDVEEAQPGT